MNEVAYQLIGQCLVDRIEFQLVPGAIKVLNGVHWFHVQLRLKN